MHLSCLLFAAKANIRSYFVNDQDEVRNIEEPNYYFKYLLSKNLRVNDRQRFHFNGKYLRAHKSF